MNSYRGKTCIFGGSTVAFLQLNVRGRLILGFSLLCILLAAVVGTTIIKVRTVNESTDRTVNLRVPTAMNAGELVADVYASLASLRGWLLTGNDVFKTERAVLWKDIQARGSEMDRLSGQWTTEQNRSDWKQAKPLLDDLRSAQDKAEAIAHTVDEQPAAKILATEAAPLAKLMLQKSTSIIEEEGGIASTDARKSLLIDFADLRGSTAMAIGAIRAYLLTADGAFKTEFAELWALNQKKFDALEKRRSEMTVDQQKAFDALVGARTKFAPLPQKMFDIRASDRWNMAQWFLTNEAAPRANKLLDIFAGTRNDERLAFGRDGCAATGQSEKRWCLGSRGNQFSDDLALGAAGCRHRRRVHGRLSDQPLDRATDPQDGGSHGATRRRRSLGGGSCHRQKR